MDYYSFTNGYQGQRSKEKEEVFKNFLVRMVDVTHSHDYFDKGAYVQLIKEICDYYNLAKGTVEFYQTTENERKKDGEIYCDFDNGHGDREEICIRIDTKSKAVVIGRIFMANESDPLDDQDKEHISRLLDVILSFVARIRLQKALEMFGFSDEQGYPNYRAFARYLTIENSKKTLGGKFSTHFDLHNFTYVNQDVGRELGDEVMRNYFNMLKGAIGGGGIVCRLGGDKFVGIFPESVEKRVREILSGVPVTFGENRDRRIIVSAAAGIYRLPKDLDMKTTGDVMDATTMASAIAKRSEDGAIVYYNEEMKFMRERMKQVQLNFRKALEDEEFQVYYQPKVDIQSRKIMGAEALCRWIKDDKIIPPMEFIPVLEMNMDICDLDFYMLDHVCRDIRRWLDEGRHVVRVSVNMSRKHLSDVDLLDHLLDIIDSNMVPHEYIEIELTETTTDVHFRDLKRVVSGLREAGIHTAVDDFGVGYSSLNLIREIPWDVLKIDRCFVPMDNDSNSDVTKLMFKHVASMALDMGLEVVVEGVETDKQIELLQENFCNIAQGFYFDRPLSVDRFEKRLEDKWYDPKSDGAKNKEDSEKSEKANEPEAAERSDGAEKSEKESQ